MTNSLDIKRKKKENKELERIGDISFYLWTGTWMAAVWIRGYRVELFLTGLFSVFIGLLSAAALVENQKKGKK
jgi:hypothetical protein